MSNGCHHIWTLFCQGAHGIDHKPYIRVDWQVDICILCYAKKQVLP